jgi:AcrR family transcriptional regulator
VDTAQAILKAARGAFDKQGPDGLSMRDIAKVVGITPMAIYRHYANKQALIDALVLDALNEWSAFAAEVPAAAPLPWLLALGEAHLEFALRRPRRYEAAFLLHTSKARRYPDDFVAGKSPAGALHLKLIGELLEAGVLIAASAIEVFIIVAGLSQGLITLYRAGRTSGGEAEFRALYQAAMRRCYQSFLAKVPK